MIVLDLCQPHYQVFLITYLKFANNLSEICQKECKVCKERRKIKSVCNFVGLKNNKLNYKCKECKRRLLKPINELIKKFPNAYQFCNESTNKFALLLRKGVYPYEYMDGWERFNETSLLDKEAFNDELNLEDYTDEDYTHYKKVSTEFELKNLGDYHDFYVQCSNTFLLADVFENFGNKCIEIYEFDPAHFFVSSGISMASLFKKDRIIINRS